MEVVCKNGEILQPIYDDFGEICACISVFHGVKGDTVLCCDCVWEGCPMRGGRKE